MNMYTLILRGGREQAPNYKASVTLPHDGVFVDNGTCNCIRSPDAAENPRTQSRYTTGGDTQSKLPLYCCCRNFTTTASKQFLCFFRRDSVYEFHYSAKFSSN